jgi:hypothetical protein
VQLTQILLGAERESNSTTTGCIESLTLVFICIQAGILGMTSVGKIFMLKLVLFVGKYMTVMAKHIYFSSFRTFTISV